MVINEERWDANVKCRLCRKNPCTEHDVVCSECLDKLQTHYAETCRKCGNYHFIEWTEENVMKLSKQMGVDFEALYNIPIAVVWPLKQCPKCCPDGKVCQENIVNPRWDN